MKKMVYVGIVMAALISITGCTRSVDKDATAMTEQGTASKSLEADANSEESDSTDTASFVAGFALEENDTIDSSKKEKYHI